jgi:adenosine 3'-phospho 5'-phosphosulfate transporter B3
MNKLTNISMRNQPTSERAVVIRFSAQCVGIIFFFVVCSYIEELLFKGVTGFHYSAFMTTYELFGFALLAFCLSFSLFDKSKPSIKAQYENITKRKAPIKSYVSIAFSMTAARLLTNGCLEYLNYPTQVIFKSLKLPVVMVGSLMMRGKKYSVAEYSASLLLAFSAALFSLGDNAVSPEFSYVGISMVLASLVGDSIHSNTQEEVLQKYEASNEEMMLYSNFLGGLLALVGISITGELQTALAFFSQEKWLYFALFLRTVVVYCGVWCINEMIRDFGVVMSTFMTTVRKVLSIFLSFALFPKPFTRLYLVAVFVFVFGLGLKVYDDRQRIRKKRVFELSSISDGLKDENV